MRLTFLVALAATMAACAPAPGRQQTRIVYVEQDPDFVGAARARAAYQEPARPMIAPFDPNRRAMGY